MPVPIADEVAICKYQALRDSEDNIKRKDTERETSAACEGIGASGC